MQSRDKDTREKADTNNKEYEITKITHTKERKVTNFVKNSEHGPDASVGYASYAFLEPPVEFLIKIKFNGRHKRKENCDTVNKVNLTLQVDTP